MQIPFAVGSVRLVHSWQDWGESLGSVALTFCMSPTWMLHERAGCALRCLNTAIEFLQPPLHRIIAHCSRPSSVSGCS